MRSDSSHPLDSLDGDDTLDRAILALRDTPVDDGPPPMVMARTQTALRQEKEHVGWLLRPSIFRAAAAVFLACGAALAYWAATYHAKDIGNDPGKVAKNDPVAPGVSPTAPVKPPVHPRHPPELARVEASQDPVFPAPPQDGVIAGRILFDGAIPKSMPVLGFQLPEDCRKLHSGPVLDESLVVNSNGTLANVVVSVSDGLGGWLPEEFPPPATAVLDQKACVFAPHVVAVMVGQPLLIRNSDPLLHNVQLLAVNNRPFQMGQPSMGLKETVPFELPEVFQAKCDVHPWMQAWVRVVDNPFFAVTGNDGRFTLRRLPPGTYTLKAWHETLGVREQQITIAPGHGESIDFTFRPLPG